MFCRSQLTISWHHLQRTYSIIECEGRETASWAFVFPLHPSTTLKRCCALTLIPSDLASGSSRIKAGKRRHQAPKLVETRAGGGSSFGETRLILPRLLSREKIQRLRKMRTKKIQGESIQLLSCSLTCRFCTRQRELKLLRPLLTSQELAGPRSTCPDCKHTSIKMF